MSNSVENRNQLFSQIVNAFLEASRGYGMLYDNCGDPLERLSEFALLLYLYKNKKVEPIINIDRDGDDVLVLKFGPSLYEDEVEEWMQKGIKHIGLVCNIEESDKWLDLFLRPCQRTLRVQNQQYLYDACKLIDEANLSDEEYTDLLVYFELHMRSSFAQFFVGLGNPQTLSEMINYLLSDGVNTVYDPFMGLALLMDCIRPDVKLVGADINEKIVRYVRLKMLLIGRDCKCYCMDSMSGLKNIPNAAIVSFPPTSINNESPVKEMMNFFLTSDNHEMILIVPQKDCGGRQLFECRKDYIDKNYLDTIIQLPPHYFDFTAASFVLLYFNKNRDITDSITIINATEWIVEKRPQRFDVDMQSMPVYLSSEIQEEGARKVKREDIVSNDFEWYPELYSYTRYFPHYYNAIKEMTFSNELKPLNLNAWTGQKPEGILNFRNITSPFSKIPTISIPKGVRPVKITEPVFVVGYSKDCMLIYLDASEDNPQYVGRNEILYTCSNDLIYPQYLALLFTESSANKHMFYGMLNTNQSINRFIRSQVFSIIPYPEQILRVEEAEREYNKYVLAQNNMEDYVEKIKTQYANEVRSRKHNMRPYLRELKASHDLAKLIIDESADLESLKLELRSLLDRMEYNRKGLSEIIDHLSQVDKFAEPEIINVSAFISDHIDKFLQTKSFEGNIELKVTGPSRELLELNVYYISETYGSYIKISSYDFGRMIDCILDNACVHGFDGQTQGHTIKIGVAVDYDCDHMLAISFTNDGKPLPEGFDINRYGLLGEKAGENAGTGDGGHQVVSIANHFGGYVTLDSSEQDAEYPFVTVTVHLPIYDKDYYEHEYDDIDLGDDEL